MHSSTRTTTTLHPPATTTTESWQQDPSSTNRRCRDSCGHSLAHWCVSCGAYDYGFDASPEDHDACNFVMLELLTDVSSPTQDNQTESSLETLGAMRRREIKLQNPKPHKPKIPKPMNPKPQRSTPSGEGL